MPYHFVVKQKTAAGSFASFLLLAALFLMASATASLSTDLKNQAVVYYKLEENSATPYADETATEDLDTGTVPARVSGKIAYGQDFDKPNSEYLSTGNTENAEISYPFFSAWIKAESCAAEGDIASIGNRYDSSHRYGLQINLVPGSVSCKLQIVAGDGDGTQDLYEADNAITAGQWAHVAVRYPGTGDISVYVNGSLVGSEISEGAASLAYQSGTNTPIIIGARYYASAVNYYFNGIIDEVYIGDWNTFNISHAQYLYATGNPGTAQQYDFTSDTINPSIRLIYPLNTSHLTTGYNESVVIESNDTSPHTCALNNSDWSLNVTLGNRYTFYNNVAMVNGPYALTANCSDSFGNWNTTKFNFVYDSIKPVMAYFSLPNNTYINRNSTPSITLNYTVQDLYILRTNISIKHVPTATIKVNFSSVNYSGVTTINMSGILNIGAWSNGQYKVTVNAWDTHTAAAMKETPKEKITLHNSKKTLTYELKRGDFNITTDKDLTVTSKKLTDRVTQTYDISKYPTQAEYTISADSLVYLTWSRYDCHFIVNNYYWYDCEGLEQPLVSEVKRGKEYKIKFRTGGKEQVETHSFGELNELRYISYFYLTTTPPPTTTFNIFVRDTATAALLNQNVSLSLSNLNYTLATTIINGTYSNTTIPPGLYSVVLQSPGYIPASYSVNIAFNSTTTLYAYLTNSTTYVLFTIQDGDTGRALEGANVAISGIINGSMSLLTTAQSDITGRLRYYYIPLQPYEFVIMLNGYETKSFTLNPVIFDSYYINLRRSVSGSDTGTLTGLSLAITPQSFHVGEQNATVTLISPSGALETYTFNYSWGVESVSASGINAHGARVVQLVNISSATIGDTVDLKLTYKRIGHAPVTLKYSYLIAGAAGAVGTLEANKNKTYGLSILERIIIITLGLLIMAGAAAYFAGGAAAAVVAIIMLGFFAKIGFINAWLVVVPIIGGLFLLWGRSE